MSGLEAPPAGAGGDTDGSTPSPAPVATITTTPIRKRTAYLVTGALGLLFSAGYLVLADQMPFGSLDQPGAAVFPILVGAVFVLASAATLWEGWQMDRTVMIELPAGQDRTRVLTLIGLLLGYLVALPWLGQIIASALFFMLLMRVLSDKPWPRIVAYSLAMSLGLYGVFVFLLKVPMPRGVFGF